VKDGLLGGGSVVLGTFAAGVSIVIVLGSVLLAFTEGEQYRLVAGFPTLESIDIAPPTPTVTLTNQPLETAAPTLADSATATLTSSPTQTGTETHTPQAVECEPPPGWIEYTIQRGDTLNNLAESSGITPQELADANCLVESRLSPGSTLYLPPLEPTATVVRCGPPFTWVTYIIQPGDTLFNIAQRTGTTVSQIKIANCLASDHIRSGQRLYVPRQPAPMPSPTVPTATAPPPTSTSTPLPTATPTDSNISTPTPPYPYPVP
jgi:LysM repeat protein